MNACYEQLRCDETGYVYGMCIHVRKGFECVMPDILVIENAAVVKDVPVFHSRMGDIMTHSTHVNRYSTRD